MRCACFERLARNRPRCLPALPPPELQNIIRPPTGPRQKARREIPARTGDALTMKTRLVELAGGWPEAFLTQRKFRHKTVKRSFQAGFWFAVASHQFIAIDELPNSAGIDAILREVPGEKCRVRSDPTNGTWGSA